MENVLHVFNQNLTKRDDRHRLIVGENSDDPLVQKVLDRLNRAITIDKIIVTMPIEDELNKVFGKIEWQLEDSERRIAEQNKRINGIKEKRKTESLLTHF